MSQTLTAKKLKTMMQGEFQSRLDGVDGGIFISTQGLNSEKTYSFRAALHARNIKFTIMRNAFARKAFTSNGYKLDQLDEILKGALGMVYTTEEGSATESAKAIDEWKRANKDKVVQWMGAFLDGEIMGPKQAKQLKDAPTKEQARAMLLGIIQAPVTQLLATIREPGARVVYLLNAYHDKRNEAGE